MRQCQEADAGGADAGAEDGDAQGVAPKEGDVLTDPAQGLDLVQQPIVALGSLVPGAQKSWRQAKGGYGGNVAAKANLISLDPPRDPLLWDPVLQTYPLQTRKPNNIDGSHHCWGCFHTQRPTSVPEEGQGEQISQVPGWGWRPPLWFQIYM